MPGFFRPIAASLLPLSLACGAAAMTKDSTPASREGLAPPLPRCEIRAERRGNAIALEGLVFAPRAASGSYRLRVSQRGAGGSSEITQGGEFTVAPDGVGSLGTVSLMSGGSYTATLRVQWEDHVVDCRTGTPPRRVDTLPPVPPEPDPHPLRGARI